MPKRKIPKYLTFSYLVKQEKEVSKLTLQSYQKPLKVLDQSIKYFLQTLDLALYLYETTQDQEVKDYCKYYLSCGNAVLHLVRSMRLDMVHGYYGSCAILLRTFINYLNMATYLNHYPSDVQLLLTESEEDFVENKKIYGKFHEASIKKELKKLGHKIPDEISAWAKVAHGSVWGSQVFGTKTLKMNSDQYELAYSPKFSITQVHVHLSLMLPMTIDFSRHFLQYLRSKNISEVEKMEKELVKTEDQVVATSEILTAVFNTMKNSSAKNENAK